ncbi:hypothetical protein HZY97_16135 [Sphingomonas sp. R-74633]|uniref:hypothetical protein n=1 Tax=Sphingomonas sp. R-74633 TaxID=2751188 RepID=UPI0015D3A1D6|nr:hypothetical protein [Sphingomonas sp. R-74633]NYT42302.1 hypothetical protein [Sphingomonas sp. R-74633]
MNQASAIKAIEAVMGERARQIDAEGYTAERDDGYLQGELLLAADCYAEHARGRNGEAVPATWPWDAAWWKPKHRARDLIRAGALYEAEIARLKRAAARAGARDDDPCWAAVADVQRLYEGVIRDIAAGCDEPLGEWGWYLGVDVDDDEMGLEGTREAAIKAGLGQHEPGGCFWIIEARMRLADEDAMGRGEADSAPFAESRNGAWITVGEDGTALESAEAGA